MMMRRAGRFTPDESVEVAARTRIRPCRKAPSMMSRSSKVRPEEMWLLVTLVMVRLNLRAKSIAVQQEKKKLKEHSPFSVRN